MEESVVRRETDDVTRFVLPCELEYTVRHKRRAVSRVDKIKVGRHWEKSL